MTHWKKVATRGSSSERGCPTSGTNMATIALGACMRPAWYNGVRHGSGAAPCAYMVHLA